MVCRFCGDCLGSGSLSYRSSAAGSSNEQVEPENFQVFISFSGETRTSFTIHLFKDLDLTGYRPFMDVLMTRGQNIEKELTRAIRNSQVIVIVISPCYASSESCLQELTEILRCRRRFGLKVLPVFYHVDPGDVYNLTDNFGAEFYGLVNRLEDKRVKVWKEALEEVASISGLVLRQHQYEAFFTDEIVAEVGKLLSQAPQRVIVWHSFINGFNSWMPTAPIFGSYIIIVSRCVASPMYLFRSLKQGLMVIRSGISATLYLNVFNRT